MEMVKKNVEDLGFCVKQIGGRNCFEAEAVSLYGREGALSSIRFNAQ